MPSALIATEEDAALLIKDYEELVTLSAVAKKWGCNRVTVRNSLRRLGVEIRENKKACKDDYHPKLGIWSDQMVANDIERKTGRVVSRAAVQQARVRRGIPSMTDRAIEAYLGS